MEITIASEGFYKYTVAHQGTLLCESSFHITQGLLGDLNVDGVIGSSDILELISNYGCTSDCFADINGDGTTEIHDLLLLLSKFGDSC